jgi:hypothetical protein
MIIIFRILIILVFCISDSASSSESPDQEYPCSFASFSDSNINIPSDTGIIDAPSNMAGQVPISLTPPAAQGSSAFSNPPTSINVTAMAPPALIESSAMSYGFPIFPSGTAVPYYYFCGKYYYI